MDYQDNFKVRCYMKGELALLYTPDVARKTAVRTLQRWIHRNTELTATLSILGYRATDKMFSVAQVREIVRYLGRP